MYCFSGAAETEWDAATALRGPMENGKFSGASDLEVLRLLRAFLRISDPKQRREVLIRAEKLASAGPLTAEAFSVGSKSPLDGADQ
jgi:hypothetical protein